MTRRKLHMIREHLRDSEAVSAATRALHLAVLRCDRKAAHRAVDRLIDMNLAAGAAAPVTLPAPMEARHA